MSHSFIKKYIECELNMSNSFIKKYIAVSFATTLIAFYTGIWWAKSGIDGDYIEYKKNIEKCIESLDIELEQEVIKKIKKEYKNSTIISVSHRKVPIMFSDKIYKIEKSKISRIEKNKILK